MGPDTLNRAISKLFGREPGRKKQPPNKMGKLEHFTVHDLRRTFRSLAASLGIASNVAERCLNHKLKGVEIMQLSEGIGRYLPHFVDSAPNNKYHVGRVSVWLNGMN